MSASTDAYVQRPDGDSHRIESLRAAMAGDRKAKEALVDEFLPMVRKLLFRLKGFRGDVDDEAQEVFARLFSTLASVQKSSSIESYVYGICIRVCREFARQATRRGQNLRLDEQHILASGNGPLANAQVNEERIRIHRALQSLPNPLREVLVLDVYQELTPKQIAEVLRSNSGAIRNRLHRARRLLAKHLTPLMIERNP